MGTHLPLRGAQMVKYCADYSNSTRARLRKRVQDDLIPTALEPENYPQNNSENLGTTYPKDS